MASWHVQKGSKNYFCIVSGGYVLVGSMKDKTAPPEQHKAVTLEAFQDDKEQQAFIKKNLGDEVLRVTNEKVDKLLADKNKATLVSARARRRCCVAPTDARCGMCWRVCAHHLLLSTGTKFGLNNGFWSCHVRRVTSARCRPCAARETGGQW